MIIRPGITLYHGSYCEVPKPDPDKCRSGKDFGRGFYLTTSRAQAVKFTKTSVRKAVGENLIDSRQGMGYLSKYRLGSLEGLETFEFAAANPQWLRCVVAHRKQYTRSRNLREWERYDVIAGKIANDTTNLVITAYMDGVYGEVGSAMADEIAIRFLEPDHLKDQLCFRSSKAMRALEFLGSEKVML